MISTHGIMGNVYICAPLMLPGKRLFFDGLAYFNKRRLTHIQYDSVSKESRGQTGLSAEPT